MYAVLAQIKNYNGYTTVPVEFEVEYATMVGRVTAENVVVEYDGELHGITIEGVPEGATITYKDSDDEYVENAPMYSDVEDEAYVIFYKVEAPGYKPYEGSATVTIEPKEITLVWENTEFTYDGEEHVPQATIDGDDLCNVTVIGAQSDAGEYDATALISDKNYKIKEECKSVVFVINKSTQDAPVLTAINFTIIFIFSSTIFH